MCTNPHIAILHPARAAGRAQSRLGCCARASTRTASGPSAATARKPSSIYLLRGVRVMAAMSDENHLPELTAPLPMLTSMYTVPYIWRFAHEAAERSAHIQALAHPCVPPAGRPRRSVSPGGIGQQGPENDRASRDAAGSVA